MEKLSQVKKEYERWVLSNGESVARIEGFLRMVLFFLPRLNNAEEKTEAAYSAISLLSLYHDTIFLKEKRKKQLREKPADPLPPAWWTDRLSVMLTGISYVQLFTEMIAYRGSNKKSNTNRNTVVFFVELLKAIIKLVLLYKAKGSILVHQTVPPRNTLIDTPELDLLSSLDQGLPLQPKKLQGNFKRKTLFDKKLENQKTPYKSAEWNYSWKKQVEGEYVYIPTKPQTIRILGELLHILRPLIYVMFIIRYGMFSWKPWFFSLLIDFLSLRFTTKYQVNMNKVEKEEINRRKLLLFYYLVRSPFWENVTLKFIKEFPLPGFLTNRQWFKSLTSSLGELVKSYRQYYFYISAS